MVLHNKMLNDHLDMKDQSMIVDYEMGDLECQLDCMLKDPNIKKRNYSKFYFIFIFFYTGVAGK